MTAPPRSAALGAAGLVLAGFAATFASPAHSAQPVTFAEVLRDQRAFSAVRFSPDGKKLMAGVERNDAPTHGASAALSSTEGYVWDLRTGVQRHIGPHGTAFFPAPCDPWSPHSDVVAGFSLIKGQRRLRTWNAITGRIVTLGPSPTTTCPTWVGRRLVYATNAASIPGVGDSNLRRLGYMAGRWRAAVTERKARLTVDSSDPDFPSPMAAPGALVVADPVSGRATRLAVGDFHSITPSPDGRLFAVVRLGSVDAHALYAPNGRRGVLELYQLSATSGVRVAGLADVDVDFAGLAWSPDSRRLLVGGRDINNDTLGLTIVNLDGSAPHRIALPVGVRLGDGPRGALSRLRPIGWLGERAAFIASAEGGIAAPSDGRYLYGEGGGRGFHLFAETEDGVRDLAAFSQQSVTGFASSENDEGLIVAEGALWGVGPDQPPRRISPPGLQVTGLAAARPGLGFPQVYASAGGRTAVTVRTPTGELHTAVLADATGRIVSEAQTSQVAALSPRLDDFALQTRVGWTHSLAIQRGSGRPLMTLDADWRDRPVGDVRPLDYEIDGRRLRAWVVLPPGYAGGRLPALLWIYGGQNLALSPPGDALPDRSSTPVFNGQLWASRGYAVIYPSTPMSGAAASDVAKTLADESLAAVDAAATAGWIDPGRVGIIGHSFGAFSAVAVLSQHPDRFRAGVAMSGPYDFSAGWGARLPEDRLVDADSYGFTMETVGFVENGQIGLATPPWIDPPAYVRASPFFFAPRITTPLLLTVGDLDLGSTSLQQSERLYAALLRSGNPAVLVRYWGSGHVQADPGAVRDQWTRFGAWFDRYLKGKCQEPQEDLRLSVEGQSRLARPVAATSGTRVCQ